MTALTRLRIAGYPYEQEIFQSVLLAHRMFGLDRVCRPKPCGALRESGIFLLDHEAPPFAGQVGRAADAMPPGVGTMVCSRHIHPSAAAHETADRPGTTRKERRMSVRLFVGGLSFSTSTDRLREAFARFGVVDSAAVMTDRETGRSRGFGFVEMASTDEAERAIGSLNGSNLDGRTIRVDKATPRGAAPSRSPVGDRRPTGAGSARGPGGGFTDRRPTGGAGGPPRGGSTRPGGWQDRTPGGGPGGRGPAVGRAVAALAIPGRASVAIRGAELRAVALPTRGVAPAKVAAPAACARDPVLSVAATIEAGAASETTSAPSKPPVTRGGARSYFGILSRSADPVLGNARVDSDA